MKQGLAGCALALLSALAWAQSPPAVRSPSPAPSAEEPKRAPLNLRLEDAGSYARDPVPASGPVETLPSLGTGANAPSYDMRRNPKDPIPKDTAPDKQM